MLQYMETDFYKKELSKQTDVKVMFSIWSQIKSGNISSDLEKCILRYEDISHHIEDLKRKNRGADALLEKGIESYKNGRIIIFNGELTSYDQYKLPSYAMFVPIQDRLLFNINGLKKANWKKVGQDEYEYAFSSVLAELKFILVTSQVMYEILINKKEGLIVNDSKLMPLIVQTYVDLFKKAVGRNASGLEEWDIDKVNYVISKFFYMHVLGFSEKEADKVVSNILYFTDWQISDIKLSEENIDYTDFYTFTPTMTILFYKKEIQGSTLINNWSATFGSSVITEIEYFPALLTHLLVLIFGVEFVNRGYDLRSKKDAIYQRLSVTLK